MQHPSELTDTTDVKIPRMRSADTKYSGTKRKWSFGPVKKAQVRESFKWEAMLLLSSLQRGKHIFRKPKQFCTASA